MRLWFIWVRVFFLIYCQIDINHNVNFFALVAEHDSFYNGRVFGELISSVRAHIEDGLMTLSINLPNETYHIEVGICLKCVLLLFINNLNFYCV